MSGLFLERNVGESVTVELPTDLAKLLSLRGAKLHITVSHITERIVELAFRGPKDMAIVRDDAKKRTASHAQTPDRQGETRR